MPQGPIFPPAVFSPAVEKNAFSFSFHPQTFLHKLAALVETHYADERFGAAELSRLLCLCPMQVHRKIKRHTGMPPGHYILYFRLNKALFLLQHTELSIGEIAWQTGFGSQSYFTRAFRKTYGLTPRALRQDDGECYNYTNKG